MTCSAQRGEPSISVRPFWQARATALLASGLGLKIPQAVAEAHDGTITLQNGEQKGAMATCTLPVDPGSTREK